MTVTRSNDMTRTFALGLCDQLLPQHLDLIKALPETRHGCKLPLLFISTVEDMNFKQGVYKHPLFIDCSNL